MTGQVSQPRANLRVAQTFAGNTAHHGAPVRRAFVRRSGVNPSPLEGLMRAARGGAGGGRGGRTRLALLLSLWWVNSAPPYSSQRPASWWAELIGLDDPVKGPRAVAANLQELARRGFIDITAGEPGMANIVTLLDELDEFGPAYVRPDGHSGGSFFRVPEQLWTTGAIGRLSGPGLVMYLMVLYYHHRPDGVEFVPGVGLRLPAAPPVWFSPKAFSERHGFSEDTRLAGIQNLRDAGMVQVETELVDIQNPSGSGHRRFRRQLLTLDAPYVPPPPGSPPTNDA